MDLGIISRLGIISESGSFREGCTRLLFHRWAADTPIPGLYTMLMLGRRCIKPELAVPGWKDYVWDCRNLKTKPTRGTEKIFWQPLLKISFFFENTQLHGHVSQRSRYVFRLPNHLLDHVVCILRPYSWTVFRLVSKKNMFLPFREQFLTLKEAIKGYSCWLSSDQ